MERVVTLAESDVIGLDDLPPPVRGWHGTALGPSFARNDTLRVWARRYVRLMAERCDGNKRRAAGVLGISYHTLKAYRRDALDDAAAAGGGGAEPAASGVADGPRRAGGAAPQ